MSTPKLFWAGLLVSVIFNVVGAPSAHAEPLTPLTPAELQYLEQIRRVFSVSHDPVAFGSDGELLSDGRFACSRRAEGYAGYEATLLSPVVTQVAFIYLCPK